MLTGCGVGSGSGSSGAVGVSNVQNSAPTADAGPDQTVDKGAGEFGWERIIRP